MQITRKAGMAGIAFLSAVLGTAAFAGPAGQNTAAASGAAMSPASAAPQTKPAAPAMPGKMTAKASLTHEQVLTIQKALIAKGQPVKADGIWGWKTRVALKDFQKKNGLPATGHPDSKTLTALGITL